MSKSLEVGDKVACYGCTFDGEYFDGERGVVVETVRKAFLLRPSVLVKFDCGVQYRFHRKQLRRLKFKKKETQHE